MVSSFLCLEIEQYNFDFFLSFHRAFRKIYEFYYHQQMHINFLKLKNYIELKYIHSYMFRSIHEHHQGVLFKALLKVKVICLPSLVYLVVCCVWLRWEVPTKHIKITAFET
jgi:hypothetical protein